MMLSQIFTNEVLSNGSVGVAGGVVLVDRVFALIDRWSERKDRKVMREESIKQTEILRNMEVQMNNSCKYQRR